MTPPPTISTRADPKVAGPGARGGLCEPEGIGHPAMLAATPRMSSLFDGRSLPRARVRSERRPAHPRRARSPWPARPRSSRPHARAREPGCRRAELGAVDRFEQREAEALEHVGATGARSGAQAEQRIRAGDSADVISPGTAKTSRPSSSARSAVISAPLRSRASTTRVAAQRPATMRFRAGNRHGAGSTPARTRRRADRSRRSRARARDVRPDSRDRSAAEHGDRSPARLERAAMRFAVHPSREAADHDEPGRGELPAQPSCDLTAVRRAGARAHDRDRRLERATSGAPRRAGRAQAADRGSREERRKAARRPAEKR